MSTKKVNVTAQAVITGDQLDAAKTQLPLPIIETLKKVGDASKRLAGSIENLAEAISTHFESVGVDEWYSYENGDPSEDAEPVHELKGKIIDYYENDLGHSNGSAVWNKARNYAETKAIADDPETDGTRGKKAPKKEILEFLIGNGSYEYGKNKGELVSIYRRLALETEAKRLNPALRQAQHELAAVMRTLGFEANNLEGKKKKD